MDLGKQQIKHTLMQEKRCNFIVWNLIALHPHLNLLFQASVSCLSGRVHNNCQVKNQSSPDSGALNLGVFRRVSAITYDFSGAK